MKKMKKFLAVGLTVALALALVACGGSTSGSAPDGDASLGAVSGTGPNGFPSETITLVCPFSAGGGTDLGARYMATTLSEQLGVNVVVENQTGSGGWIAWTDLITGDYDDGYTIGLINHNYVMGALDPENPRKYTLEDVQVISNQVLEYNIMAIRSDETRYSDMDSFIAYAKSNPILIASNAVGITDGDSTTAEWFNKTFGTQITTVPVDGASDARSMFVAGDTDVFFASVSDVQSYHQSGEMKVLCVFSENRTDFLPDVPTIKEATGKEYVAFAARGYFYPKSVSPEIVAFMNEAMQKAMQNPTYIANMATLGLELDNTSGEAYNALLQSQVETRHMVWG
ncbi:MAG: tripartite tricarboxylate transporter substrate-binding protein [Candidatus Fimivivens sp.]